MHPHKLMALMVGLLSAGLVLLAFPTLAFAQTGAPAPLTALTPTTVTIATLAFLVAFLVNAFNTGKVFGIATVPQTWLPYVGVAIPFVSAIYATLSAADSLSSVALFNALQSGLFALLSSAIGAGTHSALAKHVEAPKLAKLARLKGPALLTFVMCICGVSQVGCISSVPIVASTPANSAQVSACQNIASTHNDLVVAGFALGGVTSGVAGVSAAESSSSIKTNLAVTAAVAGALGVIDTAIVALTGSEFANGGCGTLVGALPAADTK